MYLRQHPACRTHSNFQKAALHFSSWAAFTNPLHPGGEESRCSFLCSAPGMFSGHSMTEMSRLSWNENAEHPWVCSQTESLAWGCSSARHPKPCQTPKKKLTVVCPGIALRVVCSKQIWTSKFFFFKFPFPTLTSFYICRYNLQAQNDLWFVATAEREAAGQYSPDFRQ